VSAAIALGTSAGHAASLPDWADRAAAQPTPEWAAGAPALLLHDEQWIQVPRRGRVRILVRGAVRVLSARGASRASSVATFSRGTSELQDFRAWVRDERGDIRTLGQKDAVEVATAGERTLYSDERALVLAAAAPVRERYSRGSTRERKNRCSRNGRGSSGPTSRACVPVSP